MGAIIVQEISLFAPPLAFVLVLGAAACLSLVMSRLAMRKESQAPGTTMPYACGEDLPTHLIQPSYARFLPFAIFFTILHVVALIIATLPSATAASVTLAVIYILVAVVSLCALYRR